MYTLQIPEKPALDAAWYERLMSVTTDVRETFIVLEPGQPQLRAQHEAFFASGCRTEPNLRPKEVSNYPAEKIIDGLRSLLDDIEATENNTHIRAAYAGHIREQIANLELIQAAAHDDRETFLERNVSLYGMPDKAVFGAVCAWIRQELEASRDRPELSDLAEIALELMPESRGAPDLLVPASDVFKSVRDAHFSENGYFSQLFSPDGYPDAPYIEQEHGDAITRQAIVNVGADYTVASAEDGLWAVLPRSREVVRPPGYRVDRDYFSGVIAHEIGSHLLEEANGSRQPLRLLRLGLEGFEKGNEGRAYLREQIIYPATEVFMRQPSWEYILALHLSVSLGSGLAGRPYSFSRLYELLYALHRFWRERRYPLDTINDAQTRDEAWFLAVRVMKGTASEGGCYMKDTVYLEGNIACWRLAAKKGPSVIQAGDIGKFNILDDAHWDILRGLGIVSAN